MGEKRAASSSLLPIWLVSCIRRPGDIRTPHRRSRISAGGRARELAGHLGGRNLRGRLARPRAGEAFERCTARAVPFSPELGGES